MRIAGLAIAGTFAACNSDSPSFSAAAPSAIPVGGPAARPVFGPTTVASSPPPPISGGTLLAMKDGAHAVAADPERDSVYVVDLKTHAVVTVALTAGDEPGRVVEDGAGRIHVALRSGGALATLDPSKGTLVSRRDVCGAPRGVAWDSATDLVWVACATGELVALPAGGGPAVHAFTVERDLRDVIVRPGSLAVTKFRSAEVLRVAGDGTVSRRDALPSPDPSFAAHVAWRTVAGPTGIVVAVHQAESTASVTTTVQGGYGGGGVGCSAGPTSFPPTTGGGFAGFPDASGSFFGPDDAGPPVTFLDAGPIVTVIDAGAQGAAAVDAESQVAVDAQSQVAVDAAPGNPTAPPPPVGVPVATTSCLAGAVPVGQGQSQFFSEVPVASPPGQCLPSGIVLGVLTALGADGSVLFNAPFPGVLPVDVAASPDGSALAAVAPGNAFTSGLDTVFVFNACGFQQESRPVLASDGTSEQPIAVAFGGSNRLLVQTRQPAELRIYGTTGAPVTIALSSASREDTGHDVFHTQAGAMIACASCHPEGRDDGHIWVLDDNRRRTPSLQGTIAGTAPYHWPGDEADLNVLVNDVYTVRMNGDTLAPDQMGALTGWVQTVPAPPAPAASRSLAATRGQALFERADVGCTTCHSGPKFTNNKTVDVGTGGAFQVPPLVGVGWRTPLMHDGCAATIADRFGACSTAGHGSIGSLSAGDISDMVAYLETL